MHKKRAGANTTSSVGPIRENAPGGAYFVGFRAGAEAMRAVAGRCALTHKGLTPYPQLIPGGGLALAPSQHYLVASARLSP